MVVSGLRHGPVVESLRVCAPRRTTTPRRKLRALSPSAAPRPSASTRSSRGIWPASPSRSPSLGSKPSSTASEPASTLLQHGPAPAGLSAGGPRRMPSPPAPRPPPKTRRSPPRATIEFVSTASTRSAPVTLRYRSKLFPHRNRPGLRREQGTFSSSTTSTSGSSPRTGKYSASRPLTRQGPTSPVDEPRTLMRPRIVRVVPRHDNFGRLLFEPALHRRRRPVTLRSRHPPYGVAMGHVLTT